MDLDLGDTRGKVYAGCQGSFYAMHSKHIDQIQIIVLQMGGHLAITLINLLKAHRLPCLHCAVIAEYCVSSAPGRSQTCRLLHKSFLPSDQIASSFVLALRT